MTAVSSTAGYPKLESLGSVMLYRYKATDVDDAETLDTNLGERVIDHWVRWSGNPTTQTSAGGNTTESAGVITFYPSSDNLGVTVFVIAKA